MPTLFVSECCQLCNLSLNFWLHLVLAFFKTPPILFIMAMEIAIAYKFVSPGIWTHPQPDVLAL